MVGLLGFGATAFGLSPLAPDASDLPRRLVTESVTSVDLAPQLDALVDHELELYRSDLTRVSDTADSLLNRLNAFDSAAAHFLRTDATARRVITGRAGKMVQVRTDAAGRLTELVARSPAEDSKKLGTHFTRLTVLRDGDDFSTMVEQAPLDVQVRMGSGTIRSSLFAATDDARIPDVVAVQLAEIFSSDIDFRRELRRDDRFSVVYEAPTADGEPITWNQAAGRVVAAEFVNNGRAHTAVWFQGDSVKGGYYDFDGKSKRRSFLSSPMEFSRVTSGFAMRFHPILQTWRQHKGVDFGAPTGTPVRTVADGVVEFAGWQNGYGNVVSVNHGNDQTTLYAHLSRIDVRPGQKIDQGDHIGAVGSTGWATGPHLHFEFKVRGEQRDPLTLAQNSQAVAIAPSALPGFMQMARGIKTQLAMAATAGERGITFE